MKNEIGLKEYISYVIDSEAEIARKGQIVAIIEFLVEHYDISFKDFHYNCDAPLLGNLLKCKECLEYTNNGCGQAYFPNLNFDCRQEICSYAEEYNLKNNGGK